MGMDTRTQAEVRTALALSATGDRPTVFGMSFPAPAALAAIASTAASPAAAIAEACKELALDFAFASGEGVADEVAAALREQGCAVFRVLDGPLSRALAVLGWAEGIRASAAEPERLSSLLDDGMTAAIDELMSGVADQATAVVIADDLAGTAGPLVAPDFAFDEIFPRMAGIISASGVDRPYILHSDGDVRVFARAIKAAGFSAVHGCGGLSWEAFERVYWCARKAGLALVGGVPTQELTAGDLQATSAGTRVGVLAQAGGLLIADDGGMTTPEQMTAFVSAISAARATVSSAEGSP